MKNLLFLFLIPAFIFISGCSRKTFVSNGESIYRSGKNLQGQKLLDKNKSQLKFIRSCQTCHGPTGKRNRDCIITYSNLSDPKKLPVPYTDSLFFRFLNQDLKSDGSTAITGVHWNMCEQDKKDLLDFLKSL